MPRTQILIRWLHVLACFAVACCLLIPPAGAGTEPPAGVDNVVYGKAPLAVQFNTPPLGLSGALAYRWEFGDGGSSADPAPLHVYLAEEQFTARVTVAEVTGASASKTVTVYVGGQDVGSYPAGDVNRDCLVNILDLIAIRNKLGAPATGDPADVTGDGKIDMLDLITARDHLGHRCGDANADSAILVGSQMADVLPPEAAAPKWEYAGMWETAGATTPTSSAGKFAQRAQVWDLGQTVPFTFTGKVARPQGSSVPWVCTVRNYWGELLQSSAGTAYVGADGTVTASAAWTADRLGIVRIEFRTDFARSAIWVAVIRPIGSLWGSPANPFGGMGQHPGYEEFIPYLDIQKRIGMKTLRVEIATPSVAPSPTTIDTAYLDSLIDPLNARGFRAVLLLTYLPGWMKAGSGWRPEWSTTDARSDWFASMVGKVVAHCSPKGVKHYEIWNEPNLSHFWPWGGAAYCDLLRKCYQAAKAADPGCSIISGGMPSLPGAFSGEIGSLLIDGSYRPFYDILGGHYYRAWAGYSPEHPSNAMNSAFRQSVARADAAGRPTWDTESDYGYFFQNEWESMNWYTRQMAIMLAAGVRQITQYNLANAKEKLGYTSTWWHNFFAMIANHREPSFTYDSWPTLGSYTKSADCFVYTPLPRLPAFSASVHELTGAVEWTQASLPDGNWAFVCSVGGVTRAVCWRGGEDLFTKPEQFVRGLKVGVQPSAVRDVFGNEITASTVLPLGPSPVYVDVAGASVGGVKTAIEAGAIQASPGVQAGSFNLQFIAEKLRRKTTGMPRRWHVLGPIADPAKSSFNSILPAEIAIAPLGTARMAGTAYAWAPRPASIEANSSKIDLQAAFAPDNANKTAILYAAFISPTARRGRIHFMASEDVRIQVNGVQIASMGPSGPLQPNRYSAPGDPEGWGIYWGVKPGLFDIRPGRNIIVVKVHGTTGQFGLFFRIAWENFETMNDLVWEP